MMLFLTGMSYFAYRASCSDVYIIHRINGLLKYNDVWIF